MQKEAQKTATVNPLPQEVIKPFTELRFCFDWNFEKTIQDRLHESIVTITTNSRDFTMNPEIQSCISALHELYRFFGSKEIAYIASEVEKQYKENSNLILLK